MAMVIAVGVRETGEREVLGLDVGLAETYEFWLEFLRRLVARGLRGVRLVASSAHEGLKRAIAEELSGRVVAAVPGALHAEPVERGCRSTPSLS